LIKPLHIVHLDSKWYKGGIRCFFYLWWMFSNVLRETDLLFSSGIQAATAICRPSRLSLCSNLSMPRYVAQFCLSRSSERTPFLTDCSVSPCISSRNQSGTLHLTEESNQAPGCSVQNLSFPLRISTDSRTDGVQFLTSG